MQKPGDMILLTETGASQQPRPGHCWRSAPARRWFLRSRHRRRRRVLDLSKLIRAADGVGEAALKLSAHLEFDGHHKSVAEICARAEKAGHRHARGRRAERRASAGGRAGHRLRFLCLLRPQDLRTLLILLRYY